MSARTPAVTPVLRRAAEVTDEDVEQANAAWAADAPRWFRYLLDATPYRGGPDGVRP